MPNLVKTWVEHRYSVSLTLSLSADIVWITCIMPFSVSFVCPVASIDSLPAPRIRVRMPVNVADGIGANALASLCSPVLWSPRRHKTLRDERVGPCFSLPAFEWSETKRDRNAVKETVRTAVQPSIWSQKFAHTWKSASWMFVSRMITMTIMKQFRQRKNPTPNFWRVLSLTFQSRYTGIATTTDVSLRPSHTISDATYSSDLWQYPNTSGQLPSLGASWRKMVKSIQLL